jgi:hypothetical protein
LLGAEFLLSSSSMVLPAQSRNRAAILVTAAVIALLVGGAMPDMGRGFTLRFLFLMSGLVCVAFGGVWLYICWDAASRYARLKAGQGVITRWTIDPAHWERFRQQSKEWDKIKGVQPNSANLDQTPGASGIEIVVTRNSMLVGEEFYPFEENVRVQGPTERMEFHYSLYRRYGPQWPIALRIPLPPDGQHHRAQIGQVYNQAKAAVALTPRNAIYFFLAIVVGLAALTGLVALVMHLLKLSP